MDSKVGSKEARILDTGGGESKEGPVKIVLLPEGSITASYKGKVIKLPMWALREPEAFVVGHEIGHAMMDPEDTAAGIYAELEATIWQVARKGYIGSAARGAIKRQWSRAEEIGLSIGDFLRLIEMANSRVSAKLARRPLPSLRPIWNLLRDHLEV